MTMNESFYEGYAYGAIEQRDDTLCAHWEQGRNAPTPEGFLEYVRSLGDDLQNHYWEDLWNQYLARLETLYRIAFRNAWAGYVANAYEPDSEEWASELTWKDIRSAALHHAECEWTDYL